MESNHLPVKGLTSHAAKQLLQKYGANSLTETRKFTLIKAFISQFDNVLIILLLAAAIVSFLVGESLDSFFIFLIVLLNAFFGLYQEYKAEKALAHLKNMTTTLIRVIRDSQEQAIDSRELVPGDVIYLEEGTKIPADCQVIDTRHLEINEASLTGESLPVVKGGTEKDDRDLFMGTVVVKGRGYAIVTKTGDNAKFGQIAKTLSSIKETKTPLQKKLEKFSQQIGFIGIAASLIVFALSFIKEKSLIESFLFSVSLAVAAVPEGLPAVMTITLAIGVERMARKKAIVRRLNAIEALGSITVIATDKTGTLTANKMKVKKIFVENKSYDIETPPQLNNHPFVKMLTNGVVCSTASLVKKVDGDDFDVVGDATEGALLYMAQKVGYDPETVKSQWKITNEKLFDPVTKIMTVVAKKGQENLVFTKGAPESILDRCNFILNGQKREKLTAGKIESIKKELEKYARKGLRVIAFSYKNSSVGDMETNQIFLGFVGIADQVRPEVAQAVAKTISAGIRTIMITGDNPLTAEAIGLEAGIIQPGDDIMTGSQLDNYSDEELLPVLSKVRIFARTSPEHKLRLVRLLQQQGEVVAVTGDGVNDALALKQADVGVAMGITGTDVAKETAHVIITDDNYATLVNAIEQGRNIFSHIKNAIKYLLACNIGEVIYIIFAVIFGWPILTPLQLLYINLVTDGLPAIALAFSPNDINIMKLKPKKITSILENKDYQYIFFVGICTVFLAYFITLPAVITGNNKLAVTLLFSIIVFIQPFILVDLWLSHRHIINNYLLLFKPVFFIGFLFPFILHPFILYLPFFQQVFSVVSLSWSQMLIVLTMAMTIFIPIRMIKKYIFK